MEEQVKYGISNEYLETITPSKSKGPVTRTFELADDIREVAKRVIQDKKIDVHPAKIVYLKVFPNISKSVAAKCIKATKELNFFMGHNYLIEFSAELWDVLDKETREILVEHELRKILVLSDDKTGTWNFKLRNVDVMQFSRLMKDHGTEWSNKIRLCLSSLYGLTPAEEDSIKM